jgi:hypothetical protein
VSRFFFDSAAKIIQKVQLCQSFSVLFKERERKSGNYLAVSPKIITFAGKYGVSFLILQKNTEFYV